MTSEEKRAFPNTQEREFLRNNNCSDRIYTYLLLQSKWNPSETHRYVEKMTNIEIAEKLGISRNTVGKRINDLKAKGYIIQEGKYYKVPKIDYYTLIPKSTLDFLLHYITPQDKIIKLYVMLWDFWVCKKTFSIVDLHTVLGYKLDKNGKPYSKNSAHIRELLLILQGASLVNYTIIHGRNTKGAPIEMYRINWVRSQIPDMFKQSYVHL